MKLPIVALMLALTCGVAAAQERGSGACRDDAHQYCSQAAGGKAITDCLLDHQKDISDACYDTLKQRMDNQRGVQACKQDSEQFCKGTQPGGGRIVNCLMDHQKELSDACYDALAKREKEKGRS